MIGRLSGKLLAKHPPQVLLDVGGVAYELDVPMSTFYGLPATGESVSLHTHLVVREDAHTLYGFGTLEERSVFRQLIRISGIGARTALSVLSGMSVADLAHTVAMQDAAEASKGSMVALIGADDAQAQQVCDDSLAALGSGQVLVPANYNAPGQIVLSGSVNACAKAVEVASAMGLRATALSVAGAFHSPLMQPAADRLATALEEVEVKAPKCIVV